MPGPTLPWAGYNLFRLAAVVFMAWALVVQVVVLAADMKEYADVKDNVSTAKGTAALSAPERVVSSGRMIGITSSAISTSSFDAVGAVPTVTLGSFSFSPADADPAVTVSTTSTARPSASASTVTTAPPVGVIGIDPDSVPALINIKRAGIRGNMMFQREEADITYDSYYGDSAIPKQPGGPFFVAISRLLIAGTLLILLFVQLGLPEDVLYKHCGLLGPQSTPTTLGGVQLVIAIESLRVRADQTAMIPSWCLLGVGLVNVLVGCVLIFLGRRLPKDPPPPLYFSKMMRLSYWTHPPVFYAQLDPKDPSHPDNIRGRMGQGDVTQEPSLDVEKQLPPSNALEIGLEEIDEDRENEEPVRRILASEGEPTARIRPAKDDSAHTDVRKGGYPTFSGHAVNAPGRNVPAGYIDDARGDVRFVSEEAQRIRHMQERQAGLVSRGESRSGKTAKTASSMRRPDEPGRHERRLGKGATPTPFDTSAISALRRPPARTNWRDSATSTSLFQPDHALQGLPRPGNKNRPGATGALTPISEGDEPALASTSRSDLRRSVQAAASDLGPHFPLPPSRLQADNLTETRQTRHDLRARRESSVDSMAGDAPWTSLAWDTAVPARDMAPRSAISVPSANSPGRGPKDPTRVDERGLRSPRTTSTNSVKTQKSAARPLTMLRSSMAPNIRSPTTAEARDERVSRGVRFDLALPELYSPSVLTGSTASLSIVTSPKSGFRVPGTSFTVPIPFSGPSTPRTGRNDSTDSTATVDSSFSPARPESLASTASLSSTFSFERQDMAAGDLSDDVGHRGVRRTPDERAGLPRRDSATETHGRRPMSVAVLGGGYLDGGDEVLLQKNQRRRYSSVDSS